jgi:hypothetical protein
MVLFIRRPLQTIGWALTFFTLALGSSAFLPITWIVITASVCLYFSNRAAIEGIERVARDRPPADEEKP